MLSHEEMIRLQAEEHTLIETGGVKTREEYVLQLVHTFPYVRVSELAKDKKVLDLGCNTGYGTEILSKTAKEVIGADVSEEAILAAKSKYGQPNLRFEAFDGARLPFQDDEFEIIVSFQVIEHIVDYGKYISELKRVLAPAGIVLFTTPNALLRLDPGMRPWNRFHNREFDALNLGALLDGFFPAVGVLGLFAEDHLYAVELARVHKARQMWRIGRYVPDAMLGPARGVRNWLARLSRNRDARADNDNEFANRFSLKDLFYRRGDLSAALDLMAICGNDRESLEESRRKLTN